MATSLLVAVAVAALLLCSCAMSIVVGSSLSGGASGDVETMQSTAAAAEVDDGWRGMARGLGGARSLGQRVPEKAPPPPKPNKYAGARPSRPPPPPPPPFVRFAGLNVL
ncbi:uncharacterized protein LOC112270088 [Brachypodium distachyon]|uniref:Uncharacterized protein n=1 Tax=Brachypodium distachyon TaxID=15368 RepID=A0A2K2DQ20_BRADI|nr:uncharacterized protein LOC112270088 [Brachypodium distachyon]PNT76379.1 hypothetical protein BRADI_1g47583v3 [Brachypodium distachyon]|eukprot:XP_024313540.1 uncharacterized protein LOC112270088 [Brachypodium distachyon]